MKQCLILFLFILMSCLPTIADTQPSDDNQTVVNAQNDDKTASTSRIKTASKTKSVKINRYDFDKPRYHFSINWSEGEKSFLTFNGQKYKLELTYEQEKNKISKATFSFKDNENRDKTISFEQKFLAPFKDDVKKEIDRLFNLLITYLDSSANDSELIEQLDLRPFYKNFVKNEAVQELQR